MNEDDTISTQLIAVLDNSVRSVDEVFNSLRKLDETAQAREDTRLLGEVMAFQFGRAPNPLEFHPHMRMGTERTRIPSDLSAAEIDILKILREQVESDLVVSHLSYVLVAATGDMRFMVEALRRDLSLLTAINVAWTFADLVVWQRSIRIAKAMNQRELLHDIRQLVVEEDGTFTGQVSIPLGVIALDVLFETSTILRSDYNGLTAAMASWFDECMQDEQKRMLALRTLGHLDRICSKSRDRAQYNRCLDVFYERTLVYVESLPDATTRRYEIERLRGLLVASEGRTPRVTMLDERLDSESLLALNEMTRIEHEVDLSSLYSGVVSVMSGSESVVDALMNVLLHVDFLPVEQIEREFRAAIEAHPLGFLFPVNLVTFDGLTNNHIPGIDLSDPDAEVYHRRMVRFYVTDQLWWLSQKIMIAKDWFVSHYGAPADVMTELVQSSPFVPRELKESVFRCLMAGLTGDGLGTISYCATTIEGCFRELAKQRGVAWWNVEADGQIRFSGENLLSRLLTANVISKHIHFTMNTLLYDRDGVGIRHEYAHGFQDGAITESQISVFLWGAVLKLVCYGPYIQWVKAKDNVQPLSE